MDVKLPCKSWHPHPMATWNDKLNDWTVDVNMEELIKKLGLGKDIRLIISNMERMPHIEIDDVNLTWENGG